MCRKGTKALWEFSRFAAILRFKNCVSGRRSSVRTSIFASESKPSGPNKNKKVSCMIHNPWFIQEKPESYSRLKKEGLRGFLGSLFCTELHGGKGGGGMLKSRLPNEAVTRCNCPSRSPHLGTRQCHPAFAALSLSLFSYKQKE